MIDRAAVFRYRAAAGKVTGTASTLADAARPGLQDGSPWSGLLSLHLRASGVGPDSWRDASLVQVFGLRGAVYLVPRDDLGIFTAGLLPTDPVEADLLRARAHVVHELVSAMGPMSQADVVSAIPGIPDVRELRRISTAGGFVPVWDTTDTVIHAREMPNVDQGTARAELTRRFFRYLGPASVPDLAWWLGVTKGVARDRSDEVSDDLVEVPTGRGRLLVTRDTVGLLDSAPDLPPVLLVPPEDPLATRPTTRTWLHAEVASLVWPKAPPPGMVLVDGEVVGIWRRRRNAVRVSLWGQVAPDRRRAIEAEGIMLPLPFPESPTVTFC